MFGWFGGIGDEREGEQRWSRMGWGAAFSRRLGTGVGMHRGWVGRV